MSVLKFPALVVGVSVENRLGDTVDAVLHSVPGRGGVHLHLVLKQLGDPAGVVEPSLADVFGVTSKKLEVI